MKKIYYLVILFVLALSACQKQPNLVPATYVKSMNLTLQASDYQLLPTSDYPYSALTIDDTADAHKYIPLILNKRDPQLGNGSTANVTYTVTALAPPAAPKPADSTLSDVAYTLTSADYGGKFNDFSQSQLLTWLQNTKFPTPNANQLTVLTFNLFASGSTTTVTQSFMYLKGALKMLYTLTPAQYTSIGKGFDDFSSSDDAQLPNYFNSLLKADLTLTATASVGQVVYVSYAYFSGVDFQRVQPMIFDGTNWTVKALPTSTQTLEFVKSGGTWIPNPTVYYTLTTADTKLIANSTFGTASQRSDVGQYGDFSGWSPADLNNAIILVLTTDFPTPKVNVNYNVTYLKYTGSDVPTVLVFKYDGTKWSPVTN